MGFTKTVQELMNLRRGAEGGYKFFDAEMLFALYRTKPDVVQRVLPPPLEAPPEPRAIAFVAHYPRTSFGLTYHEAAIFLEAGYRGERGSYCLAMPVTDDMAMVGGREIFGLPKKIASISLERREERVTGRVERKGVELLTLEATIGETAAGIAPLATLGGMAVGEGGIDLLSFTFKFFASAAGGGFEHPPRLIRQVTRALPKEVKGAEVKLALHSSPFDPFAEVEVVEILGGFYGTFDLTMQPGKVLMEIEDPLQFLPYAFSKVDM